MREESARDRWNQRYRERPPAEFGLKPSDWLLRQESFLRQQLPGRALDLACGNGRNAIYLAQLGFQVDAVDISEVAIDWLRQYAVREGLSIRPRAADLTDFDWPEGAYQLITNFNFLERSCFPAIANALAPGGLLVFETFTRDQVDRLGSSIPLQYTLAHNELLRAFPSLRVLFYQEGIFFEQGKQKKRGVACLVAQRP